MFPPTIFQSSHCSSMLRHFLALVSKGLDLGTGTGWRLIQMFARWFGPSARPAGRKLEQSWDNSPSHQSPACSQCMRQSAQASSPRIHQRGQVWHLEKWAQPSTHEDKPESNVTELLSMREWSIQRVTRRENVHPEHFPLFWLRFRQLVPHDQTSWHSYSEVLQQ